MKTDKEKLELIDQLTSNEVSQWHKEVEYRIKNEESLRKSQEIAFEILRALRTKGLSQKELAEKLNITQQQVSKWLKGNVNFTMDTIESIENALAIKLLDVRVAKTDSKIKSQVFKKVSSILLILQKQNEIDNINWNEFNQNFKCSYSNC